MSKTAQHNTLAVTLERIQALMSELRQTESLAAQIHEMVVMKRHRLDSLMSEYVEMAGDGEVVVLTPVVEVTKPVVAAPVVDDLPMSSHGNYGAPKDLLQGRPVPSAQHVLDSLNRLMVGIKDISAKQAAAA